ncbi:MAG: hypothetical protein ACW99F_13430 [Candidatus Hodarchaeales archaeon]|jgi:hypothetical protein
MRKVCLTCRYLQPPEEAESVGGPTFHFYGCNNKKSERYGETCCSNYVNPVSGKRHDSRQYIMCDEWEIK